MWWWPSPSSTSSSTRRKNGEGGPEDDPVDAGTAVGELADAPVGVGLARAGELVAAPELDANAGGGRAALGVEHVGRDGHGTTVRHVQAGERRPRPPSRAHASTASPPGGGARGRSRRVGSDELAVPDDVAAADDQTVDAVRGREDEAGDGIRGAAELEPVCPPDREVGALARLERADVVAAEDRRAARASRAASASRALSAPGRPGRARRAGPA